MKNEGMFDKCKIFTQGYAYFVFRVVIGVLFMMHGLTKFGVIGGKPSVAFMSLMGAAGTIEVVAGAFIALGLWTRLLATLSALLMLVAYGMAHASKALSPLANGGELALVYFAAFLALATYGAGIWALEKAWCKKECF